MIFTQKMEQRRLLSQTGMPVREVANHVGFRSVCNFSVAFCHRDQGITRLRISAPGACHRPGPDGAR